MIDEDSIFEIEDNYNSAPYYTEIPSHLRVSATKMAREWCVTKRRVLQWCKEGRIYGAKKVNGEWSIPELADRPYDGRHYRGIIIESKYKVILQHADKIFDETMWQNSFKMKEAWPRFVQDAVHHMHVLEKSTLTYADISNVLCDKAVGGKSIDDQIAARQLAHAIGYMALCVAREYELSVDLICKFRACLQGNVADIRAEAVGCIGFLERLVERVNTYRSHPICLAAEFMVRFLMLWPFQKENEKVAFLAVNFILMSKGYPPIVTYRALFRWLERYWSYYEEYPPRMSYSDMLRARSKRGEIMSQSKIDALNNEPSGRIDFRSRLDPTVLVGLFAKAVARSCKVGFAQIPYYLKNKIGWVVSEKEPYEGDYIQIDDRPDKDEFDWNYVLRRWDSKKRRVVLPKF